MLASPTGHTVRFLAGTSDPFWVVDSRLGGLLLWTGFLVTLAALLITTAMLVRSSRHRALAHVGLMCSAVMIVLLTGESVVRVYHRAAHGIPLFIPMRVFVDRELGWQGIRSFGNPESRRPKIFVVGDSFTTPGGVGEAQMYYVTLGRILPEFLEYRASSLRPIRGYSTGPSRMSSGSPRTWRGAATSTASSRTSKLMD